jgi:hypothetical protein
MLQTVEQFARMSSQKKGIVIFDAQSGWLKDLNFGEKAAEHGKVTWFIMLCK